MQSDAGEEATAAIDFGNSISNMGSGSNPVNAVNMEGKIKDELDTPHLTRVALHFQFACDFYLLADEFLSSQWV